MTIPFVDIAIVGGGPGGLALAHGLRKHGIDVAVFERDHVRADYVQGFRLRIRQRGLDALAANLPPHLYNAFLETIGIAPSESIALDERFNLLSSTASAHDREDTHVAKSVSRITLRQILLSDLDDVFHAGRAFERYEEQEDGTVIAWFKDGSAIRTNLLVGADGANSVVRRQLLPDFRVIDTGMRRLAGKMALSAAAAHDISPLLIDYNAGIQPANGRRMMITSHRVDAAAHARHDLIGRDDPTHNDITGAHFDNTTSYIWWNTAYERDELASDDLLDTMDGQGLLDLLVDHIADWDDRIVRLIRHSDPSTVALLKVRTSVPGAVWATGPVTLLGDAIHSMTYFKALGGNTALYDAGLLTRELVAARRNGKPQAQAVHDYEEAMREHGYEAVRGSLAAMLNNATATRPALDVAAE
ncbi:FAD-dependent oxidoreductase [Novosphingobium guangzhouense]|uniref:Oxidoreductase n=1 Tax=Novosphingobium guangzhouense TaxID=1850347 RepID=A0A2K2G399_9SPHN|nr:FAD-dependent monooxygenase [Novosphingobium guangzhouense]PNU05525.1 oxidoreductase [Novosphingobium guangzhouense]